MNKVSWKKSKWAAALFILLAAAFLRFYRLDHVPPGWRDDELINSLVISQHVLDGECYLFYPDASGHEALYHIINAGFLGIFGPGVPGIRWLSAFLGVISIALTIRLGKMMYNTEVGLIAGIGLTASFWSLMYSRIGLRHISLLPLMMSAWLALWTGINCKDEHVTRYVIPGRYLYFILTGVLIGASFYTYFAARGLPLILVGLVIYWWFFERSSFKQHWKGVLLALIVTALLYIPLWVTISHLPEMTGRVEELATPLVEAKEGNFEQLTKQVFSTLGMFHSTGDDEWLYNIPYRPVFNPVGALVFFGGIISSLCWIFPLGKKTKRSESAFMLIWLAVGMAPSFVSIPPASLGHTIIAQPSTYLMLAIGLSGAVQFFYARNIKLLWAVGMIAFLSVASNSIRDLNDYFSVWPQRGMVRFLYRGNLHNAADYLNKRPDMINLAFSGSLAGPWDRQAMLTDLKRPVVDRWFDPSRAILFPSENGFLVMTDFPELAKELTPAFKTAVSLVVETKKFSIYKKSEAMNIMNSENTVTFQNGISLLGVRLEGSGLLSEWAARGVPDGLPPFKLISNPPPPGADVRPRLAIFVHFLAQDGSIVSIDDGFWIDPYTLMPNDTWLQVNYGDWERSDAVEIGLYNPVTGERIMTSDGRDRFRFPLDK